MKSSRTPQACINTRWHVRTCGMDSVAQHCNICNLFALCNVNVHLLLAPCYKSWPNSNAAQCALLTQTRLITPIQGRCLLCLQWNSYLTENQRGWCTVNMIGTSRKWYILKYKEQSAQAMVSFSSLDAPAVVRRCSLASLYTLFNLAGTTKGLFLVNSSLPAVL